MEVWQDPATLYNSRWSRTCYALFTSEVTRLRGRLSDEFSLQDPQVRSTMLGAPA